MARRRTAHPGWSCSSGGAWRTAIWLRAFASGSSEHCAPALKSQASPDEPEEIIERKNQKADRRGEFPQGREDPSLISEAKTSVEDEHDNDGRNKICVMTGHDPGQYSDKIQNIKPAQIMKWPVNCHRTEMLHLDQSSVEVRISPVEQRIEEIATGMPEDVPDRSELFGVGNDHIVSAHDLVSLSQQPET